MSYKNKVFRNTLYCYLPIVVVFAVIRMLSAFGLLNFLGDTADYILTVVIQVLLLFGVSIFIFAGLNKTRVKQVFSFYRFKKINWKAILISIAMGVIVYILNVLISSFFNAFLSALGYKFSNSGGGGDYPIWMLFVNLLLTAVLPAICEETAHRGMVMRGFVGVGQKKALIISSILFGLLHLNIQQVFYATLIGLFVGYLANICNSIYPAMIIHFMNNAISVIMGFSSHHNLGLDIGFQYLDKWLASNTILTMFFMILLIIALLWLLKILVTLIFKVTTFKQMAEMEQSIVNQVEKEIYLEELKEATKGNDVDLHTKFEEEDFERIYKEKNAEFFASDSIDNKIIEDNQPFKLDKVSKIMLYTTFAIVSILTIFTFIWGIL